MTSYQSKRAMAQDKLKCQCSMTTKLVGSGCQYCNPEYWDDDDDAQVYQDHDDTLTIAYQSGYYDGKKAAGQKWNFCPQCGKRTQDIHTCTPPQENT